MSKTYKTKPNQTNCNQKDKHTKQNKSLKKQF